MLLTAKILLTIATLGYSAIPAVFDSNATHATNPSFPGHARFHIVWQVSSYVYVAILALYLTWSAGAATGPLWLAFFLAAAAYGGFWTAVLSRGAYGGKLVSEVSPVPNFRWSLLGRQFETDANVTLFTPAVIITALAGAASRAPETFRRSRAPRGKPRVLAARAKVLASASTDGDRRVSASIDVVTRRHVLRVLRRPRRQS